MKTDAPLLTTAEVCALGRCSKTSLWRRRRRDPEWLPPAREQLGCETVFERGAVLRALGLTGPEEGAKDDGYSREIDDHAFREAEARALRRRAEARRRDEPGSVRGPGKAPTLRLVGDKAAAG